MAPQVSLKLLSYMVSPNKCYKTGCLAEYKTAHTQAGSKSYLLSTEANDLAELLVDTNFKGG